MERKEKFLKGVCGLKVFEIKPLTEDASTRKYWRVEADGKMFVLMDGDAVVNKFYQFVKIAKLLRDAYVYTPEVYFTDLENGLMLLEDLGDDTFNKLIKIGYDEEKLYQLATELLIKVSHIKNRPDFMPVLSEEKLLGDICFFVDWYYPLVSGRPIGEDKREEFRGLIREILPDAHKVPNSVVLWDYHVDNIMMTAPNECAVLDFQDAFWGPVTYDVMSLLQDARREVDPKLQKKMKELFYRGLVDVDAQDFEVSYNFYAMFRHMRVLGRFSILMATKGKDKYLKYVPHLWDMLEDVLKFKKFKAIKKWVDEVFPKELRVVPVKKPIVKAMILAAGRGTRMKELGDKMPKPLMQVKGKALIDYKLDMLREVDIKDVVVNLSYQAEKIEEHLRGVEGFNFIYSHEPEALETGGGVKKALPMLGDEPFFTINTDEIWREHSFKPYMWQMIDKWDSEKFDFVLLLAPMEKVYDEDSRIGNYRIKEDGSIERNVNKEGGFDYMYVGTALVHPRVLKDVEVSKFSMRDLYDVAQEQGRLGYLIMDEEVYHVGSPADLELAEKEFS